MNQDSQPSDLPNTARKQAEKNIEFEYAWLAGFTDADGSINAQIVYRGDYKLKYQIRVTFTLFQTSKRHFLMLDVQKLLKCGTVRNRNDGMSEFCIVGHEKLKPVLQKILPYLKLKRKQALLVLEIIEKLPYTKDPNVLLEVASLVDKVGLLTDGKLRKIKADTVRQALIDLGHDV